MLCPWQDDEDARTDYTLCNRLRVIKLTPCVINEMDEERSEAKEERGEEEMRGEEGGEKERGREERREEEEKREMITQGVINAGCLAR